MPHKREKGELEELMRRALAGDRAAYASALEKTGRLLRPYLGRRLANAGEVEDVLQETLLSIHKARHTYDPGRPYAPWAYAIARYRLQDHLRALYADPLRLAADVVRAEEISAETVTQGGGLYESIKGLIDKLPPRQARILHLLHGDGFTAREAAAQLGMTESAVKVAAHRAYKILRKRLLNERD